MEIRTIKNVTKSWKFQIIIAKYQDSGGFGFGIGNQKLIESK